MDDEVAGQDHADHGRAVEAQVDVPAMPAIPPSALGRQPQVLSWEGRHSIGWQNTKCEGSCFVVVRLGSMASQKVLDRFPLTQEGWAAAWAALARLDAGAARRLRDGIEKEAAGKAERKAEFGRRAGMYRAFADADTVTRFPALNAQVLAGDARVYTIGVHDRVAKANSSRVLGPLAGAEAVVTDGSQAWSPGRAMFLPVGLTGLATKTVAHAAIIFPDGTTHASPLDGNAAVRDAQLQAVQFNALAGAFAPPATGAESDPATRLRKLQELLDARLLSQDEYEAKRAEIIKLL